MPLFRTPLSTARALSKIPAQSYPQQIYFQRVKYKKRISWKFIGLSAITSYVCAVIYANVVSVPLMKAAQKAANALPDSERTKLQEDEHDYIPLPFTIKEIPPTPYAGDDPEWQAFIALSHDQKAIAEIRERLAAIALDIVKRAPAVTRQVGLDVSINKWWVLIRYPTHPPPEFTWKVIQDSLQIVEQKVDPLTVERVRRALWPAPLVHSMWGFSVSLFKQHVLGVAKLAGYSPKEAEAASNTAFQQAVQQMDSQKPSKDGPPAKGPGGLTPSKQPTNGPIAESHDKQADSQEKEKSDSERINPKDLYPYESIRSIISGSWPEFLKQWRSKWRPLQGHPPRGVVVVTGLVEMKASHGYVVLDCAGFYDPKTKDYVLDNMHFRVRQITPFTQRPLR